MSTAEFQRLTLIAAGVDSSQIPPILDTATWRRLVISAIVNSGVNGCEFICACSDETTLLTTGVAKMTFRAPYNFNLTNVRASVNEAPTGSNIIVDINKNGTTVLSTKLTIDEAEKTSFTAAVPPVISVNKFKTDNEITIDLDDVGSTSAGKGLKVTLIGIRT
jgi:hypothetical protein